MFTVNRRGCAFIVFGLFIAGCSSKKPQEASVLLAQEQWTVEEISPGVMHYAFPSAYMPLVNSVQNINVLAVDTKNKAYSLVFQDVYPQDSLSSIGQKNEAAFFGLNGTYYEKEQNNNLSTSYVKTAGVLIDSVEVTADNLYFWKHEGAFYSNGDTVGIVRGNNQVYAALDATDVFSGAPLLIENFVPVGAQFVSEGATNLKKLPYEHPDRHQGVRHPRSAVAIAAEGIVLFVAVDGRSAQAEGMSAKELTTFLRHYFNPQEALNLDGGGSTTFWLKKEINGRSKTGVINYPTDNKRFDHEGQRSIRNAFLLLSNRRNEN